MIYNMENKNRKNINILKPNFKQLAKGSYEVRVINIGKCQIYLATKNKIVKDAAKLS